MSDLDQRLTFVILWLFAMMNYIYGDIAMIFSLFVHPEQLARLQQGLTAGGKEDLYFLGGAIFMNVAFLMLPVSWLASHSVARLANIGAGVIFTLAMAAILLAPLGRGVRLGTGMAGGEFRRVAFGAVISVEKLFAFQHVLVFVIPADGHTERPGVKHHFCEVIICNFRGAAIRQSLAGCLACSMILHGKNSGGDPDIAVEGACDL